MRGAGPRRQHEPLSVVPGTATLVAAALIVAGVSWALLPMATNNTCECDIPIPGGVVAMRCEALRGGQDDALCGTGDHDYCDFDFTQLCTQLKGTRSVCAGRVVEHWRGRLERMAAEDEEVCYRTARIFFNKSHR